MSYPSEVHVDHPGGDNVSAFPTLTQRVWWEWLRPSVSVTSWENIGVQLAFQKISPDLVDTAFQTIALRQDALRYTFVEGTPDLRIVIKNVSELPARHINWSRHALTPQFNRRVKRFIAAFIRRPFERNNSLLCRALIISLPRDIVLFAGSFHHLIFDGRSVEIFNDLMHRLLRQPDTEIPDHRGALSRYAQLEIDRLSEPGGQHLLVHWRNWFSDVPALNLPSGKTLVSGPGGAITYPFQFSNSTTEKLKSIARTLKLPAFGVWLTLYSLTLGRWSGQNCFGLRVIGDLRGKARLENVMGMLACTDYVQIKMEGNQNLQEVTRSLFKEYLLSLQNRLPPLPEVYGLRKAHHKLGAVLNFASDTGPISTSADSADVLPSENYSYKSDVFDIPFPSIYLRSWFQNGALRGQLDLNGDLISAQDQRSLLASFSQALDDVLQMSRPAGD